MVLWGDAEKKPLSTKQLQTQLKISNHCQIIPNTEWKKHTDWMPMTILLCDIPKTKEELWDKEGKKEERRTKQGRKQTGNELKQ